MSNPAHEFFLTSFAIADDDSDDSELFAEALFEIDPSISIERFPNGHVLLNRMKRDTSKKPDIIFLDINMPEMNGWECLQNLKTDSNLSNIPVVIYSTSSTKEDKDKAVRLGASFFFTKPDSYGEIRNFLSRLVSSPQAIFENSTILLRAGGR